MSLQLREYDQEHHIVYVIQHRITKEIERVTKDKNIVDEYKEILDLEQKPLFIIQGYEV